MSEIYCCKLPSTFPDSCVDYCVDHCQVLFKLVVSTSLRQAWESCGAVSDDGNNYKRSLTIKIRVNSLVLMFNVEELVRLGT